MSTTTSPRKAFLSVSDTESLPEKEKNTYSEITLGFLQKELKACQQLLEAYEVDQISIADSNKSGENNKVKIIQLSIYYTMNWVSNEKTISSG